MRRPRHLLTLGLFAVLAAFLVACGGSSGDGVSADDDPQAVIDRTFSDENTIKSAAIDATINVDVPGEEGGEMEIALDGAVNGADQETPDFDLNLNLSGQADGRDIDFDAGMILTQDAGFIKLNGEDYQIDPGLLEQFRGQVEQAAGGEGGDSAGGDETGEDAGTSEGLFGSFDIEEILTDLTNEGTVDVDGTETVKVSGTVDVSEATPKLNKLMEGAGTLQGLGVGVPGAEDLDQLEQAIGDVTFNVYSGADDGLLRRIEIEVPVKPQDGSGTGSAEIVITLSDVNEEQTITVPTDAKPFGALISGTGSGALKDLGINGFQDLGNLGDLGGLGGLMGGGDDSAGGSAGGGSGSAGSEKGGGDEKNGDAGGSAGAAGDLEDLLEQAPDVDQARAVIRCLRDAVHGGTPTAEDIRKCEEKVQ